MGPVTSGIFSVVCCILAITKSGVHGKLLRPILEIDTEDLNDVIMVGSSAYLNCTNSLNAQRYYLRKDGNMVTIKEQITPVFTMTSLSKNDNGLYTCQYSRNSEFSEVSDPEYLYVSDRYPPPTITAEPKSIVQPGQNITIKCNSLYPNMIFTLFKGNIIIKENDGNPFIYVIHNANKGHAGQYSCKYRKLQIQSDFSSPLMISVKALPRPLITWEDYEEGGLKISCTAPEKDKWMWFQLFNKSKDVVEEMKAVNQNQVEFFVPYPELSHPRYYCMYRIRMGSNFADSLISDAAVIGEETLRTQDYTKENIIRLLLSTIILILITVIVVTHFKSSQRSKSRPPKLPAQRKKLAIESQYTQMEVMKTEEDSQETAAAQTVQTDSRDESCHAKEAKEVVKVKNDGSLEKSSALTPSNTVVYAVIEQLKNQEEQQTCMEAS